MLSEIWRKKSESDALLRVNMAFTFYKVFVCLFLFYFVFCGQNLHKPCRRPEAVGSNEFFS